MRSWERKDITDILIKHHEELRVQVSLLEWNLGEELDDDCIVIENFLEENYKIIWDGLKFHKDIDIPSENTRGEHHTKYEK
jgi:hypothetical protein